jgi:hypothetical protein
MAALTSLVAVLIGGALVLIGDVWRLWIDDRRLDRRRLTDAATDLAACYNTMAGKIADGHRLHKPLSDVDYLDAMRHELSTRFWTLRGSQQLLAARSPLTSSWQRLVNAYPDEGERWTQAWTDHLNEQRAFEVRLRDHALRPLWRREKSATAEEVTQAARLS